MKEVQMDPAAHEQPPARAFGNPRRKLTKDFLQVTQLSTDERDMEVLHCQGLSKCLRHKATECILMLFIFLNFVLVILETDYVALGVIEVPIWLSVCNLLLLTVFAIELTVRFTIHGRQLLRSSWFALDVIVVVPDLFVELAAWITRSDLPSLSLFRVMRVLRLARAVRILSWFPELFALVKGLVFALKAIFWGMLMILFFLVVHSVIAVQFIHPLSRQMEKDGKWADCADCSEAFSSVSMALLTFFSQIIAGDSWSKVSMPIILEYPATSVFFGGVFISVGVAVMNLILAVIVDKAADAKENTLELEAAIKTDMRDRAHSVLLDICQEMDTNCSGTLTYDEFVEGYENVEAFREICSHMDLRLADFEMVFAILDTDGDGDVCYDEFVTQLYRIKNEDSHTLLVFIKCYVAVIHRQLLAEMVLLKDQVGLLHNVVEKPTLGGKEVGGGAIVEGGGAAVSGSGGRVMKTELRRDMEHISQSSIPAERMLKCEEAVKHLCERLMAEVWSPRSELEQNKEQCPDAKLAGYSVEEDRANQLKAVEEMQSYLPTDHVDHSGRSANGMKGSTFTRGLSMNSQGNVARTGGCKLSPPDTSQPNHSTDLVYM